MSLEVDCVGRCVQNDGRTVLMVACSKRATDIVELLLAVPGVNVNAVDVSCVSGETSACCDQSSLRSLRA